MWTFATAAAADLAVGPAQPYTSVEDALRDAVSGDRILVDPGTYDVRETAVDLAVEIAAAAGPATVTLRAASQQSMFVLDPGAALTLRDLAIEGQGRRLATMDQASLTLLGGSVTGVEAAGFGRDGGMIDATTSTIALDGVAIDGALAGRDGGVIHATGSTVSVVGGSIRGGTAQEGGGFALSSGSTLTVDGTRFEANTAGVGSVWALDGSTATIANAVFVGNVASVAGTTVCRTTDCTFTSVTFDGNLAPAAAAVRSVGGAVSLVSSIVCRHGGDRVVDVDTGSLTLRNDVFVGNDTDGGLVVADAATADVLAVHFVGNTATGPGAALAATGGTTVALRNTLVAWNASDGAVLDVPAADLTGGWSLFWANTSADLPGGLRPTDVAGDPLFPAPAPGSCDAAALAPPIASPAVDAGDPGLVDADGSRSDIGAFGGTDTAPVVVIDADADGWPEAVDCDDTDGTIHPLALEVACDGIDQDCDPATLDAIDEDQDGISVCDGDCNDQSPTRSEYFDVYRDRDGDGFGVGDVSTLCGFPPTGASLVDGDCDDQSADRFPGNPEIPYDDVDQDCDGLEIWDVDGDEVEFPDDCDDEDPTVRPNAKEIEGDGIDQDCTGHDATSAVVGGAGITCGCTSARGGGAAWLGLVAVLALRRRR